MSQATATFSHGQSLSCAVEAYSTSPDRMEFPETPPSTRILLIHNPDKEWRPTSWKAIPGRSSFSMPRLEAATLAVMLNRRAMIELSGPAEVMQWAIVTWGLNGGGFHVLMVTVDPRKWSPDGPYDVPVETIGPPIENRRAQQTAKDHNREQLATYDSPLYWAVPVKMLSEDDIVDEDGINDGWGDERFTLAPSLRLSVVKGGD
jgi:hypothetical protein